MKKTTTFFFTLSLLLLTKLSSAQWMPVCTSGNGFVDNFEVFNNELYATGFFTNSCGANHHYLAKWNGSTWSSVGNGLPQAGHHLQSINTDLFAVTYQPAIDSNWVYKFDGSNFNKYGEGVYLSYAVTGFSQTANLYNCIEYNSKLVVCGEFDRVGTKHISGIMQWNGTAWDSLGAGLSGHVTGTDLIMYPHDLCTYNSDLIVCGNFKNAGNQLVNGIARWDGTQWHALGAGFNGVVYGITVYNGELYAGGDFTASGSTPLMYIAKWNGTAWVDPGFQLYYRSTANYSFIHTLKVIDNKLFISGGFDRVVVGTDTMDCTAVAAYDGVKLDTLFGGISGKEVEALALFQNSIYAGGGLFGSSYIAKLDLSNGIAAVANEQIKLVPNPSSGTFQINSKEVIQHIDVYDLKGECIYQSSGSKCIQPISIDREGLFLVSIQTPTNHYSKKIYICN